MSSLQKNINDNDFETLAFNAHSLKSVIANYMAPAAYELTRKLEELAKNNSAEGIAEIFPQLEKATNELLLELKEYVQKIEG